MAEKKTTKPTTSAPTAGASTGYDFSSDAGMGFENVTQGDLSIPFLVILQDGSPQVKKTHPDYATQGIKGAMAGHIFNTLTKRIYNPNIEEDKVEFVPCFYQKLFVEWKSRDSGGGIVKSHPDDRLLQNTKKNDKGQDVLPNGNILTTTAYFFGFLITPDGDHERCVIGLSSTQLKKARQWLSLATSIKFDGPNGKFTPPLFAHRYGLSTVPENNEKGSWYGWRVELIGRLEAVPLIEEARKTAEQSRTSQMRLAAPAEDDIPGQ